MTDPTPLPSRRLPRDAVRVPYEPPAWGSLVVLVILLASLAYGLWCY